MSKQRTAVILCGGRGTRLGDLGKKLPKTLVKIQGKEILWYILKVLKKNNFNHVVLPVGYKNNLIKQFVKKNNNLISNIDLVDTGENTNIGKRIAIIQNKIISDNFLLLNGDAIFSFDINKIFLEHQKKNRNLTFVSGEITYPYGTVGVKNNEVIDFNRNLIYEALRARNQKNNYLAYNYTGMSIMNTKKLITNKKKFIYSLNFEMDFFPFFIKKYKTNLVKLKGFWHSIDNEKDILAVNDRKKSLKKFLILNKIKKNLSQ